MTKPVGPAPAGDIISEKDFPKTPEGWAKYWTAEFDTAREKFRDWRNECKTIVDEYLSKKGTEEDPERRVPYFWAYVELMMAQLFGNDTPGVDVTRRHGDADDDEARIGGPLILERVLGTDIEQGFDGVKVALQHALFDYIMFAFGNAWVRYEVEKDEDGRKKHEDVPVDYVHHSDHLHSPCRTFEEMRWAAKKCSMTKDELADRFGDELAIEIALWEEEGRRPEAKDAWARTDVWEIWSKEHRKTFWRVEGFDRIIDEKDDFLKLRNFWPFPKPMISGWTTEAFMPRSHYAQLQDLLGDVNNIMTRIVVLEKALRLAGVYDRTLGEVTRLISGDYSNELIPVDGMAALAEKGGLENVIQWLPIKEVVETIAALEDKLARRQQLIYELTGMSDLTQGAADPELERESAAKTRARVKFTNVRLQKIQNEFARFASDLQSIRAEVMVRFFDPGTFLKRSNVLFTPDAPQALAAVMELKKEFPSYRVKVAPDQLAAQDFTALKQERGEFLTAFAAIMREAAPMIQQFPAAAPLILETTKWALAGLRGSASIEGVFDKLIKATQQSLAAGTFQQPNPEMQKEQAKLQSDIQKNQAKVEVEKLKAATQIQAEQLRQQIQTQANVAETVAQERIKMQTRAAETSLKFAELKAKTDAAIKVAKARPKPTGGGKR